MIGAESVSESLTNFLTTLVPFVHKNRETKAILKTRLTKSYSFSFLFTASSVL